MPKIGLCAIAKNENNYLREWVLWYKKLGFDKIILYDNNNINGEHFNDVIADFIDNGFVSVVDVRGKENQQIACYNECYHTNAYNLDWIAFFDIDEFLVLKKHKTVHGFLADKVFKPFNCVAVNWQTYDDNDLIEVEGNYSVMSRFTRPVTNENFTIKRIIRTGLPCVINSAHGTIDRSADKYPWTSYGNDKNECIKLCDSDGVALPKNGISSVRITHETAQLNHYRYKTITEYILNKKARGYATIYQNNGKDMSIKQFFNINKYSDAKIKKIAILLNISIQQAEIISGHKKPEEKKRTQATYLYF